MARPLLFYVSCLSYFMYLFLSVFSVFSAVHVFVFGGGDVERDDFLERIRQAAAAGRAYRPAPRFEVPEDVGYAGGGPDLLERLTEELRGAGAFPCRVPGPGEALEKICEVAAGRGARLAIRWAHPLLDRLGVDGALRARGVEVVRWPEVEQMAARDPEGARDLIFRADLGVSGVDGAAAETGTLALASLPGQGRPVSLLPPVHVAVVAPCRVVPDLFDLVEMFAREPEALPGNVALITGPSKTGDIELRLTTGVHGPGEVHVIILERDLEIH